MSADGPKTHAPGCYMTVASVAPLAPVMVSLMEGLRWQSIFVPG